MKEIAKAGLDRDIWQYFTVNTGVRSVGVMGDGRNLRLHNRHPRYHFYRWNDSRLCEDSMGSTPKISVRIVNEVDHVNRIVYDITSKPPATVEWE